MEAAGVVTPSYNDGTRNPAPSVGQVGTGAHRAIDRLSDAALPMVDRIASSAHQTVDKIASAAGQAAETLGVSADWRTMN